MELTNKQEEGLKIAIERYRNHEPYTVIAGYAGVGKSTLIKFIISALDIDPNNVAYIAYTGKAAQVLRSKGCPNAMTAHRLLYKSIQKPDGTFMHIARGILPIECSIIVVDEVSMLPKPMWDLLLSHGVYVIATGDPGQLPPIGESTDVLEHPHIFLDEIMRQAEDSEIIRLSADIREGKIIKPYRGKEINIVPKRDFVEGMMTWADQVICGKNNTRRELNDCFRKMMWQDPNLSSAPLVGDKIVCLGNDWNCINFMGDALVNGLIGKIFSISTYPNDYLEFKCKIGFEPDIYEETIPEKILFQNILIDWKLITTGIPTITKENFKLFPKYLRPHQFDYGYCITAHKSQGSEWSKVLVIEERFPYDKKEHTRWLYTACTRASQKLTLVLNS